jgi:hypothetical protein
MTSYDAARPTAPNGFGDSASSIGKSALQAGENCPLVLELVISATNPLSGTVGRLGGDTPVVFRGWIDLMGAISGLSAGHGADIADQQA